MFLEGQVPGRSSAATPVYDHEEDSALPLPAPILVYDFFSGCGGTSEGLRAAGMKPMLGLDLDREAMATYAHNFEGAAAILRDICHLTTAEIETLFEKERVSPILFSACAPCQPFSRQNRQRKEKDSRVTLLKELARFVLRFRPELIFVENVPGLQTFSESEEGPLHELIKLLDANDYKHSVRIVEAQAYGIPQNRRRLVLVASLFGQFDFPEPTHGTGEGLERIKTVRDAIGHLPPIEAGTSDPSVRNHYACALAPQNLERIRAIKEGGGRRTWSEHLKLDCHEGLKGYTDVYGRMTWDRPSPSLTTRCISLSNGRFGHPEQDRAISVREAASLQSFPDRFEFLGSLNSQARQIGNAVPPRLSEVIGRAMIAHVQKHLEQS